MERINNLIVLLTAIQNFAKDIHYNAKGDAFYSKHLLVDRVQKNTSEYIDSIKEICFLSVSEEPLSSKWYLQQAAQLIPDIKQHDNENFSYLADLIIQALQAIEALEDLTRGENSLFDTIAGDLQVSLGLINRQLS